MGLYLNHVNTCLQKLREPQITALSTDTSSEAYRAQEAVRRAVSRVWNYKQWSFKLRRYTFTTTSGTEDYVLPRYLRETYKIKSSVSPYDITVVNEDVFDRNIPNPTSSGNPYIARLFEMAGVETQPTTTGTVTAVSSSASDTTQFVLIKGLVGGQLQYEQLTLTGTTAATSTKSFSQIYSVTKSARTEGYITVKSDTDTVTNVILDPDESVLRLRKIRLYPKPDATITITTKGFGRPVKLTHVYEDTEIPDDWDYVVDQWAYSLALQAKGQTQLEEMKNNFELGSKMLEDDMATEEYISAEEVIVPERWNGSGDGYPGYTSMPAGYGIAE